jgi:hypothetical protein
VKCKDARTMVTYKGCDTSSVVKDRNVPIVDLKRVGGVSIKMCM